MGSRAPPPPRPCQAQAPRVRIGPPRFRRARARRGHGTERPPALRGGDHRLGLRRHHDCLAVGPGVQAPRPGREDADPGARHLVDDPGGNGPGQGAKDLRLPGRQEPAGPPSCAPPALAGGSLVYANVTIQPPDLIFDDDRWTVTWDQPTRNAYYDLARDAIGFGALFALHKLAVAKDRASRPPPRHPPAIRRPRT